MSEISLWVQRAPDSNRKWERGLGLLNTDVGGWRSPELKTDWVDNSDSSDYATDVAAYERPLTGEQRLASAVLEGAMHDIFSGWCVPQDPTAVCRRKRSLALRAIVWFLNGNRTTVYAFENVCDHLNLDVVTIRARVHSWCQEHSLIDRATFDSFWAALLADRTAQTATCARFFPKPQRKKPERHFVLEAQSGQVLAEFAIVCIILVALFIGMIDISAMLRASDNLAAAVRDGARVAARTPSDKRDAAVEGMVHSTFPDGETIVDRISTTDSVFEEDAIVTVRATVSVPLRFSNPLLYLGGGSVVDGRRVLLLTRTASFRNELAAKEKGGGNSASNAGGIGGGVDGPGKGTDPTGWGRGGPPK